MKGKVLYLSRRDVEEVALPMSEIIDVLEEAFGLKAEGRTEVPPKPGIHPRPESFIHAMPAYVDGLDVAGIKWVSGYPANPSKGLPYISGLLILNDPATGIPAAVMDCTWITAKRTAAASALAAKYLARDDARVLGICGCGVQGRSHLEALSLVLPALKDVLAYDISQEAAGRFVEEMSKVFPSLNIHRVSSPKEAVCEADAVVTAGPILKEPKPTIQAGWIKAGTFVTAVDFDCYWRPEAIDEVDLLFTDDLAQFRYYRSQGFFPHVTEEKMTGELEDLVTGGHPGRTDPRQRTMAMFLGLAIEDMATALRILERAKQQGVGTELEL